MEPSASIFSICLSRPIERLMVAKFVRVPPNQRSVTKVLAALAGDLFDSLLGLFLGAHKEHFAALAAEYRPKSCTRYPVGVSVLLKSIIWIPLRASKMNGLHFRVPAFGLVAKMDTGIQQFLHSDRNHKFPLVKSSLFGEPSRGTRDCFRCYYGRPR